jgi:eukaryotic-like serine/threonine-protein kinase
MVLDHSLKALYTWFDRLADLPVADQERELQSLRNAGDPLAVQLEGMLLQHRRQDPTESPFSVDEILGACEDQNALRLAVDMRELSQRLRWDAKKHAFRLGQYLLRSCLSVSSLGATYQAHDEELARDVVVLLAFPRWNDEPLVLGRMLASARAVARIFHPGIATILGTVRIEGISAVVRQWIPGESLEVWAPARGGLSLQEIVFIGRGIAQGLHVLHEEQVLHGDLKPANIIMRSGQLDPVITDFGTAFWLNSGEKNLWQGGTRGFVAPEILRNEPPSPQSDLYSLGVLLHWLTTGSLPGAESQRQPTGSETEERDIGQNLHSLIQALLEDEPAKRPASAALVAERLEACLFGAIPWGFTPAPMGSLSESPVLVGARSRTQRCRGRCDMGGPPDGRPD